MSTSNRRSRNGTLPRALRRGLGAVSVLALFLLSACGNQSFSLDDVTIDLSAVGDTGGAVVIAGRAVPAAAAQGGATADADLAVSNTAGSLHVVAAYTPFDPATDASCTGVMGSGAGPTYFLCPPTDHHLEPFGNYVLTPGTPVKTGFLINNDVFWLGVQLVGATSSTATVSFTRMVGSQLLY